jgi:signal transduction histidine kinase
VRFFQSNKRVATGFSLSAKLLLLTALFVMLAEILIFLPSIGNFRKNWIDERMSAAQIAALAVEAAPNNQVPEKLRWELLNNAQVYAVALKKGNRRQLILQSPMPRAIMAHFDLRHQNFLSLIRDAIAVYFQPDNLLIRVVDKPEMSDVQFLEVLMVQGPLKKDMISFALNILGLSIIISIFSAALVYLALNRLLVAPIGQLTENMMHFSENPQDPDRRVIPSGRTDEIGTVENELLSLQTDLASLLKQKNRLANLGGAVSKINHDLRNMLGTAQLVSDRLTGVDDPTVQRVTPRLVRSIDRAIKLCSETLQYGKIEDEKSLSRTNFKLMDLFNEVFEELGLPKARVNIKIDIDENTKIYGDYEQLYRVFGNLIRNSVQVLDAKTDCSAPDTVSIELNKEGNLNIIDIKDTGPGVPDKAQEFMFQPFKGSLRKGGTGLGLAISAEIIQAHNGSITYKNNDAGAHFQIQLPENGNGGNGASS